MKKFLVVLFFAIFAVNAFALTDAEKTKLWNEYRQARQAAIESASNTTIAIANYLLAGEKAAALERVDIQAWQLNNAGYILIQVFKSETDYLHLMADIEKTAVWAEKAAKIQAAKSILSDNIALLREAKTYLTQAKALNSNAALPKIDSNLDFIAWVEKFIE